jgi:transcriptional regulator with XRE-family HTH domain
MSLTSHADVRLARLAGVNGASHGANGTNGHGANGKATNGHPTAQAAHGAVAKAAPVNGSNGHASGPVKGARPLHRLGTVRKQQGYSLRRVARQLRLPMEAVRRQEDEQSDMTLSDLYRWQRALEVPVSELLVDLDAPLSPPIMERARMVKLMKTALAIQERSGTNGVRRMADNLVNQLLEIMPELQGVSPWHAVGQRRTLDEFGVAAERRMPDEWFDDLMP